jgi:hypothetical protein
LKQRPLSVVELNAKNTVELYGKTAQETREFFQTMKKTQFNVTKHRDYGKYTQIREMRNDLAGEILSDYPRHREFVGQFAREYFISKRTMENQVAYAERSKNLSLSDDEIRIEDMRRALKVAEQVCENKKTKPSKFYADASREVVRNLTQKLSADRSLTHQTVSLRSTTAPQTSTKESCASCETVLLRKLEGAKNDQVTKRPYRGSTVADRMFLDKRSSNYNEWCSGYKDKFGYAPHVSQSMLVAYCMEHGVKIEFFDDSSSKEYASMLAQKQIDAAGLKEPTLEITESCIKQTLCFKALHETEDSKRLNPEKIATLDAKATVLTEHITKENLHVLNDKKLMREAFATVDPKSVKENALTSKDLTRIAEINSRDIDMAGQSQIHKMKELEQAKIDRSYDLDMGR